MNGEVLELTGFAQAPAWVPWAVHYFFLIGLSVGAFVITLPSGLFGREPGAVTRAALITALTTGLAAPLVLVADLHGPARFWHFYVYPQSTSWMSWGAFFLPSYVLLLTLYGWLMARPQLAARGRSADIAGRIAALLGGSGKPLFGVQRAVGFLAAVAAALVALYTGAELAVVAARPLWNTVLVPLIFAASGLAGGAGLALLFAREETARRTLFRWLTAALALTAIIAIFWLFSGGPSGEALRRLATEYQPFSFSVWAIFGLLLPLTLAMRSRLAIFAGTLAVFGAWFLRWEIFMAGQAIPKNGAGFYGVDLPLGTEGLLGILGTAGLWWLIALAVTSLLRPTAHRI